MNSQTLLENGFSSFLRLKELSVLNLPKNEDHVLVLIDNTLSGEPDSDILYIGRARKPVKKVLGGYIGGFGGRTVKKIHGALFNDGYIEKASISLMPSDDPKAAQRKLLEKFRKEHGKYPSWNYPLNKPNKVQPKQETVKTRRTRKSAIGKTEKSP